MMVLIFLKMKWKLNIRKIYQDYQFFSGNSFSNYQINNQIEFITQNGKTKKYYLVDKLPVKFVLQIAFWLLIVVFLIFIYWSESDCWNASHSGLKKCLGARSDYLSEINNSKLLIFFWISYSPVQNNGCHGSVNFLCFNSIAIEKSLNILL